MLSRENSPALPQAQEVGILPGDEVEDALLGEAAANIVHYGGVKGFVNSFSKSLAWEWAKEGVRVNNICPGWIVPEDEASVGGESFWKRYKQFGSVASRRCG